MHTIIQRYVATLQLRTSWWQNLQNFWDSNSRDSRALLRNAMIINAVSHSLKVMVY